MLATTYWKAYTSNAELYITSGMRSFTLMCTIADGTLLYKLCNNCPVDPLCERLMSQCHVSKRFPKKLHFFDYSRTKIGKASFINRSRYIAELLTFDRINLPLNLFKKNLKEKKLFVKWDSTSVRSFYPLSANSLLSYVVKLSIWCQILFEKHHSANKQYNTIQYKRWCG